MAIHLLALDLAKWDDAANDALLLPIFSDERPLRGAAGLADWRLCGRLSRLIKEGRVTGASWDQMLMPTGRRLRFGRIVLFGIGDSKGYTEERFRRDVLRMRTVASRAGFTNYALQAPGRGRGIFGARRALELFLEVATKDGQPGDVTLIDDPSAQKDMAELLRARGTQTGAGHPDSLGRQ